MMALDRLPPGTPAIVVALPRGRGAAGRLIAMGITVGAEIQNLQNRGRGPLIVGVHGVRLALGRGQAARIVVEIVAAEPAERDRAGSETLRSS
jgi:ferrous iron transport protein A